MRLFNPSSEGFMMIRIQNVCGKAILIPSLIWVFYTMMASSAQRPLRVVNAH